MKNPERGTAKILAMPQPKSVTRLTPGSALLTYDRTGVFVPGEKGFKLHEFVRRNERVVVMPDVGVSLDERRGRLSFPFEVDLYHLNDYANDSLFERDLGPDRFAGVLHLGLMLEHEMRELYSGLFLDRPNICFSEAGIHGVRTRNNKREIFSARRGEVTWEKQTRVIAGPRRAT